MANVGSLGSPQNLTNALSEAFEAQIVRQINRKSVLLSVLPIIMGEGKRCAWDVEEAGATAATYAEAADVASGDYGVDQELPATLDWGLYRAPFQITGLADSAAYTSPRPEGLRNYWQEKLFGSVSKLGDVINKGLYTGTGANSILGLHATAGALLDTGVYAGIDRSTATFWQGNVLANGGTPRAISFDLMRQAVRATYVQSGEEPDVIVTDPIQWDKFALLFEANRRYPINTITTMAGEIKLSAGHRALDFDGIPVLRDKDHPAGKMSFLNTAYQQVKFLPTRPEQDVQGPNGNFVVHDDKGQTSGLPARIEFLGKTGDTTKAFTKVYVQLVTKRPNATALLDDLS